MSDDPSIHELDDDLAGLVAKAAAFFVLGSLALAFLFLLLPIVVGPFNLVLWIGGEFILAVGCVRWSRRHGAEVSNRDMRRRMESLEPFDPDADAAVLSQSRRR